MIPLVLPIAIAVLAFLTLTAVAYVVFAGAEGILEYARKNLPGIAFEGADSGQAMSPAFAGVAPRVEGYALPESLYYHQGHAWVALQDDGTALVGADDFAGKLIGKLSSIQLPRVGKRCSQGEKGWSLYQKGKALTMLFPLDGKIVAVNENVQSDPSKVSEEPYSGGWLLKVRPRNLKRNLGNLIRGSAARSWMVKSASELRAAFSGELGMVFQDGGLPEEGLADHFETNEWVDLTTRIFLVAPDDSGQ